MFRWGMSWILGYSKFGPGSAFRFILIVGWVGQTPKPYSLFFTHLFFFIIVFTITPMATTPFKLEKI